MSDRIDLFENVGNAVSCLSSVLGYLLRFIWLMMLPKAVLVAKVMAAESQLVACVDAVDRGLVCEAWRRWIGFLG